MNARISFESKRDWGAFIRFILMQYPRVYAPENCLGVSFSYTYPEITAEITTPYGQKLFNQIIDDARWVLGIAIKLEEM